MPKATRINQFDWMAVRAKFNSGHSFSVTWSRNSNGPEVNIKPPANELAKDISIALSKAYSKSGKEGVAYSFAQYVAIVGDAVEKSNTLDEFCRHLQDDLDVTSQFETSARNETVATIKTGRSIKVNIKFKDGCDLDLNLNPKSISLGMKPYVSAQIRDIGDLIFSLQERTSTPLELAENLREKALESETVDEWLAAVRAEYSPSAKM